MRDNLIWESEDIGIPQLLLSTYCNTIQYLLAISLGLFVLTNFHKITSDKANMNP